MLKIDLHMHTNLSDGDYNINEIIELSKRNNCYNIAITDHEVVKDYNSIAVENEINIISGIEFNSSEKGMHILGYGIKDIERLSNYIDELHMENESVTYQLIKKLENKGIDISIEELINYLENKNLIYKYLDKRHVVKYLIEKGYTQNVYDTYKNLIGRGTELYIPLKKIHPTDIINKIGDCGGVSVLAHPFTLNLDDKTLLLKVKELLSYGLDGIEVINGNISYSLTNRYNMIANELNLIKTVGSDFHNLSSCNIGIECNEEIFKKLENRIKTK